MLKCYRNCSELPIFNFYKMLKERNFSYLYVDYDGYSELEPEDDFEDKWEVIYHEYLNLTGDAETMMFYELFAEVNYLTTRYDVVSDLLRILAIEKVTDKQRSDYVDALRDWNYNIKRDRSFPKELLRMTKQLRASTNLLNLKKNELETLQAKNKGKEDVSLTKQIVKLEQALGRNNIDEKTTTVIKFILLMEEVTELNAANRKRYGKQL